MNQSKIKQTMADLKQIVKESTDVATKQAAKIKYAELKVQLAESNNLGVDAKQVSGPGARADVKLAKGYGDVVQPTSVIRKKGSDVVQAGPLKNLSNPKEVEESPQSNTRLAAMRSNNPQPQVGSPFNSKKNGGNNPPPQSGIGQGVREANEGVDTIQMDVELFIRCLEWAKESAGDDIALHKFTENVVAKSGVLTMSDYEDLIPQGEMKEARTFHQTQKEVIKSAKKKDDYLAARAKENREVNAKSDAKKVKEDASAGASGSASIAAGPAGSLFSPIIKRVSSKTKTKKSAIGQGVYESEEVSEDRYDDAWAKEKAKQNKIANAKPVIVKPEPKVKPDPMQIMYQIDVAIGNNFPDGDPADSLSEKYTMEVLDWAVRKAGAGKSYNEYIAHEWQSAMDDNPDYSGQKNPFR